MEKLMLDQVKFSQFVVQNSVEDMKSYNIWESNSEIMFFPKALTETDLDASLSPVRLICQYSNLSLRNLVLLTQSQTLQQNFQVL